MDDREGISPASTPDPGPAHKPGSDPSTGDETPLNLSGSFDAVAPILVFVVLNRLAGLRWAVVGATLWSLKVVITRRRRGQAFGRLMPLVTAAVIIRGLLGVITDSEALYFGLGIATKFAVAVALIASVVFRKPLAAVAIGAVFPLRSETTAHPSFQSTMAIVTIIAGLYYAISATFDTWLYQRSSVEGYVIVRFVVNWPLSVVASIAALYVMRRRLRLVPGLKALNDLLGASG